MKLRLSGRPANSGGSWEPSSKKEIELQEIFRKINIFLSKITVLVYIIFCFLMFGKLSLASIIFFEDHQNLLVRTQFILTLFSWSWNMSKIKHFYSSSSRKYLGCCLCSKKGDNYFQICQMPNVMKRTFHRRLPQNGRKVPGYNSLEI